VRVVSALYREESYHGLAEATVRRPEELRQGDCLILWGGEDISPGIYGERPIATRAPGNPSYRDILEMDLVQAQVKMGNPIFGICRGAQLLCALAGGKLWQHVDNHAFSDHLIEGEGFKVSSNSCHHQMMRPPKGAELLAWSAVRSPKKVSGEGVVESLEREAEIAYFPNLKALAVQGHPEWMPENHEFVKLVNKFLKEKLDV